MTHDTERTALLKILWSVSAREESELNRVADAILAAGFTRTTSEREQRLLEALEEISKGAGAYSRDPLEHASNCIEEMKARARAALAVYDPPEPCTPTGSGPDVPSNVGHVLYKDGDLDAPDVIKDRNGAVVLGLCRKCGKGEIELSEPCTPEQREGQERAGNCCKHGVSAEAYCFICDFDDMDASATSPADGKE